MLGFVTTRVSSPILVGREAEQAALRAALDRAAERNPATVLLGGEAGIGKSRLVEEFTAEVSAAGGQVLLGGCLELGAEGLPYAPFVGILRALCHELGADALTQLVPNPRELGRLLPELSAAITERDVEAPRGRLFEEFLVLIERLGEQRPAVVVVEDAHWADRSTRELIAFLVHNLRSSQVLMLVTYRTDDLHRKHPLRGLLAELDRARSVETINLPRFTRAEVAAQTAAILGHDAPAPLIEALFDRTEGNPLFVEALICSDCDGVVLGALSDSLRDLLLRSVEQLPDESRRLLDTAAAGGSYVAHNLLLAVSGMAEQPLADALRPAVERNVLVPRADGYAFRHALLREVVHDDLLPGEHRRLHAAFAQALDRDPTLLPAGRAAVEQAHHWYAAHEVDRALEASWRAARATAQAMAYAEQVRMLDRVLELWDKVPESAATLGVDHVAVLQRAANAAGDAGDLARAVSYASSGLDEIDQDAEPIRAALLLRSRAMHLRQLGRAGALEDLLAARALTDAEPESSARAQVLESLGHVLSVHSSYEEATAVTREALAVARRIGDQRTETAALDSLACQRSSVGEIDEAFAHLAAARTLAEQMGARDRLVKLDINESDMLEGLGDHAGAMEVARRGMARAREIGFARTSGAFITLNLIEPLVSLGRWPEAEQLVADTLTLDPPPTHRRWLFRWGAEIALLRGDIDRAAIDLERARTLIASAIVEPQERLPIARVGASIALGRRQPEQALRIIDDALSGVATTGDSRYLWPVLIIGAAACAELTGRAVALHDEVAAARVRAEGRLLADRAAALITPGLVMPAQRATFAAEWLRATGGPNGQILTAFDDAVRAWEAAGQPFELAYSLMRGAEAALGAGDTDGATARLRRGRALAEDLGAALLIADIEQLGRRARLPLAEPLSLPRPSNGPELAAVRRLGLTPREAEVLQLLADGRSNRQIAADLFISPKTASVHVSNILAKLGASNRIEAAATAHQLGIAAGGSGSGG